MELEEIEPGLRLSGLEGREVVEVLYARFHGSDALEITFKLPSGGLDQQIVFRRDQGRLSLATTGSRPFDADASEFKAVAEAQRIKLAGLYDPMLAVATSNVQPLPHQIRAVYGELLPRTPLRFLLADDPGAGKTIMAGLFIKELILRGDVQRCLIVTPGGLVEQWQDELFLKFGLWFEILTTQMIDLNARRNIFDEQPLLIARMDQLSRNEDLQKQLVECEWDLTIVDEAHRMGARYFNHKLDKTKRFQLGEKLGEISRHFLLMTATPHSGKEQDFQLFLSLLDKDRFVGSHNRSVDTSDIMRRMVKEDLLTFDGRRLFPERVAESIPYQLTEFESDLYEQVTDYVRNGMNRADSLDNKRRRTVGFALTILQRRLASSPEAILRSLQRRVKRLEQAKNAIQSGGYRQERFAVDVIEFDSDAYSASEVEQIEDNLVDSATAAQTVAELEAEIIELNSLVKTAAEVRDLHQDKKWSELRQILQDNVIPLDRQGRPRKIIIFTEHRDTLNYLSERIRGVIGHPQAVVAIHGGVRRNDRRTITEEFTKNPACQIMLATDAAGEGLNLQAAHLMVNYDLPWNPNRIEQRFGRIHRIGQTEVCRLWNLVAGNTREGEVFSTLLNKIDQQRSAYGGKVFDVLGTAFTDTPLRDLLIEAIRYGDQPEVRARMHEVIDQGVSEGLQELLHQRALAADHMSQTDLGELRAAMDEARARRLQPHYIELTFKELFTRFGGRMVRRENRRYEIASVPARLRSGAFGPVASRYERVTFDLDAVQLDGSGSADLLAPGHALHDAVMGQALTTFADRLHRGATLLSPLVRTPRVLVGVVEEIIDGTGASVARRFGYAYVDADGSVTDAGPAPYLDCFDAPDDSAAARAQTTTWLDDAESSAASWIIEHRLPEYLNEIRPERTADLARQRELIETRLANERNRLLAGAEAAGERERRGERPKESSDSLFRKAADLQERLNARQTLLDKQTQLTTRPPQIVTAALVLPLEDHAIAGSPAAQTIRADGEVFDRAVALVKAKELELGRTPAECVPPNPGYHVLSAAPTGDTYRIAVKVRSDSSPMYWATHNEVVTSRNATPHYRLALVDLDPRAPSHGEVRYVDNPFVKNDITSFGAAGSEVGWAASWKAGRAPF